MRDIVAALRYIAPVFLMLKLAHHDADLVLYTTGKRSMAILMNSLLKFSCFGPLLGLITLCTSIAVDRAMWMPPRSALPRERFVVCWMLSLEVKVFCPT